MRQAKDLGASEPGSRDANHSSLPAKANKLAYSVAEFGSVSGLSRSLLYEILMKSSAAAN